MCHEEATIGYIFLIERGLCVWVGRVSQISVCSNDIIMLLKVMNGIGKNLQQSFRKDLVQYLCQQVLLAACEWTGASIGKYQVE